MFAASRMEEPVEGSECDIGKDRRRRQEGGDDDDEEPDLDLDIVCVVNDGDGCELAGDEEGEAETRGECVAREHDR